MRLPAFALKRMLRIFLHGNYVEFKFIMPMMGGYQPLGQGLEQFIIGVNDEPYFDMQFYPNDFLLILNDVIYPNKEVQKILNIIPQRGDSYSILVPNRLNIGPGKHMFFFQTRAVKMKVRFKLEAIQAPYPIEIPATQTTISSQVSHEAPTDITFDFNKQRICPKCGGGLKIEHAFCKYCGQDLNDVEPIGKGDDVTKNLAISALTDPSPEVRKEAIDTLGGFKDTRSLGVLTYILINDPDETVRCEAADELGDIHHPLSMDALSGALKDPSQLVRTEALEGLKKIKKKEMD